MPDTGKKLKSTVHFKHNFRTLFDYLDSLQINYQVINHPVTRTLEQAAEVCDIPKNKLLRVVILSEAKKLFMAILPQDRFLDFSLLCKSLNREFNPAPLAVVEAIFEQCEPHSYPPAPKYFYMDSILDNSVLDLDEVYFEPGNHQTLIKMKCSDYLQLLRNIWQGNFSEPITSMANVQTRKENVSNQITQFVPRRLEGRSHEHIELPVMPPMADRLLHLREDPDATVFDLAAMIEKDPSLAARLINWAQSSYYGYPKTVASVESAIVNVFDYNMMLNLALGLTINCSIKVPLEGPLGLKNYWQFSIYTASLVDSLIAEMPASKKLNRGLAYLAAFLHNFGQLVLAELFPSQYYLLNRYLVVNPDVRIIDLEVHVLGVNHPQMGAWLLKNWGLPIEVVTAVRWHHEEDYVDDHAIYSNLVFVAIRLLKRHHLGDAYSEEIPTAILEFLGLTDEQTTKILGNLITEKAALDLIVKQLL